MFNPPCYHVELVIGQLYAFLLDEFFLFRIVRCLVGLFFEISCEFHIVFSPFCNKTNFCYDHTTRSVTKQSHEGKKKDLFRKKLVAVGMYTDFAIPVKKNLRHR